MSLQSFTPTSGGGWDAKVGTASTYHVAPGGALTYATDDNLSVALTSTGTLTISFPRIPYTTVAAATGDRWE